MMRVVIYLLGLTCIAYCSYVNLYTTQAVNSLKNIFRTYQLKMVAAIPALVAVWFLVSIPAAKCPWPFWIAGLLAAAEAAAAFFNPNQIYSKMIDWWFENISEQTHKIISIAGIIFGVLILTLAK